VRLFISGLWHLGCVTAASMAQYHDVVAHDADRGVVASLERGEPPLFEPGLRELVAGMQARGSLSFSVDPAAARGSDIVWITYDTPVDDEDRSDVEAVFERCRALFEYLSEGTLFLISSQVPVGFTVRLAEAFTSARPGVAVAFAYSPENLRLGKAIEIFNNPGRVVAGVRDELAREKIGAVFAPICGNILWMRPESAEMTKHALNAFLAVSVTFANEIAAICEAVDADFEDVQRGLRSDPRIGAGAYLSAGAGIGGGTLLRDVSVLSDVGAARGTPNKMLTAALVSNKEHRLWAERSLVRELGDLRGLKIAVLGLTYKPGTDTLRRSTAVELCRALAARGAVVEAYDPVVRELPGDVSAIVRLSPTLEDALRDASAAVVATEWPEFRNIDAKLVRLMAEPYVFDATGFLRAGFAEHAGMKYFVCGRRFETIAGASERPGT